MRGRLPGVVQIDHERASQLVDARWEFARATDLAHPSSDRLHEQCDIFELQLNGPRGRPYRDEGEADGLPGVFQLDLLEQRVARSARNVDRAAARGDRDAIEAFRHRNAVCLGCSRECRAQAFDSFRQHDLGLPCGQRLSEALALLAAELDRAGRPDGHEPIADWLAIGDEAKLGQEDIPFGLTDVDLPGGEIDQDGIAARGHAQESTR